MRVLGDPDSLTVTVPFESNFKEKMLGMEKMFINSESNGFHHAMQFSLDSCDVIAWSLPKNPLPRSPHFSKSLVFTT